MNQSIRDLLQEHPVIASIKSDDDLAAVLRSDCTIVFVLYGSVLSIADIVARLKDAGKIVFVDVDLLDGFSVKDIVVEYLTTHTRLDGLLSNKAGMVKAAKAQGILAIHRLFMVDSMSFHNAPRQLKASGADCVEILPGCVPTVISWLLESIDTPIIAGGLVCNKADVVAAIGAGAVAVASSNRDVWAM